MNKELADLTKEQLQRQQQASKTPGQSNATAGGGKMKNMNGKGKLGTSKSKPAKQASTMDDGPEEIDDIADLDKQIQTVWEESCRKRRLSFDSKAAAERGKEEYRTSVICPFFKAEAGPGRPESQEEGQEEVGRRLQYRYHGTGWLN
jgi:hypothetical protein